MKTKIGLIGFGDFGSFVFKAIASMPDFEVAAVCDIKNVKLPQIKTYKNYQELILNKDIKIIHVCTPNYNHAKITQFALEQNKKILCEKPLGLNLTEINKIKQTLTKHKQSRLLFNYVLPNNELFLILKEKIKLFGSLQNIQINNFATEFTIPHPWYWDKTKTGGWFLTSDIHFYHLIDELFNQTIHPIFSNEIFSKRKTEMTSSLLRIGNVPISITHNLNTAYELARTEYNFIFSNAEIKMSGWLPNKLIIRKKNKINNYLLNYTKDELYQKSIEKNLQKLIILTHQNSISELKKASESVEVALKAERLARNHNGKS